MMGTLVMIALSFLPVTAFRIAINEGYALIMICVNVTLDTLGWLVNNIPVKFCRLVMLQL